MIEIYTFPQQSVQWFKIKLGVLSAGSFAKVLAKESKKTQIGKSVGSRKGYLYKLASEILTGVPQDTYQNSHMERGNTQEPLARVEYEFVTGNSVNEIGFALRGRIGCSPDGLVGSSGGIEIKSVIPSKQIETVLANKIPPSHKAQIQGCMLILDCEWFDFVSYSPLIKNKNYMFIKRMCRDEDYISNLQGEIIRFIKELDALVKRMK